MVPDTRCFVERRSLFRKDSMMATIQYFNYASLKKWNNIHNEKDRDRLAIGSATDEFRLDRFMFNIWNGCEDAAEQFTPFTWVMFPPNMRHIVYERHLTPWHQDIGYIERMQKPHSHVVTCFVPLEEHPEQTATLQFALGYFPKLEHNEQNGHGACLDEFTIFADSTVDFELHCGDVLIFGDHTPHRTIPGPYGRIDRRSIEFRMLKPEDAIAGKDYFDLTTRKFVVAAQEAA